jgi:hypothetical protein
LKEDLRDNHAEAAMSKDELYRMVAVARDPLTISSLRMPTPCFDQILSYTELTTFSGQCVQPQPYDPVLGRPLLIGCSSD